MIVGFIYRFCSVLSAILLFASISYAQIPNQTNADTDLRNPKIGSLAAAAMETAGSVLQSDFLDFFNGGGEHGNSGPLLVGFLYLIAVVTAIITIAAGGNYRWGSYLLIGPPLFFFLTQVRIASDGTDWTFGNREFPQDVKERMLRGVNGFDEGQRGQADVAYFFQFWNVFTSDVTQTLVAQLNRSLDDREMNFVSKVENYMKFWNIPEMADNDLRLLIHTVLTPNCTKFFSLHKDAANPHIPDNQRMRYQTRLRDIENEKITAFFKQDEITQRLRDLEVIPEGQELTTCQELWEGAVGYLRRRIPEMIRVNLQKQLKPGEQPDKRVELFLQKIGVTTDRTTGQIRYEEEDLQRNLIRATDWIIARTLFHEIWTDNPFANSFEFEREEVVTPGVRAGNLTATDIPDINEEIRQFNATDYYQHRGEFVTAAMSMPHFQGVTLFILSACYPFFAMLVVVPGRATSILTWMGLWAWVKLWDLGFAVVMMLDDILYTTLPRAPNLSESEIMNPGVAWERILAVDPNYAAATYYNIIATCLFAVPIATGVFVKRGGGELMNLIHSSWQSKASGVGASGATFARALQGQTYGNMFYRKLTNEAAIVANQTLKGAEAAKIDAKILKLETLKAGINTAKKIDYLRSKLPEGSADVTAKVAELAINQEIQILHMQRDNLVKAAVSKALYEWGNSAQGFWLSERAVAAKYSNHHFRVNHYMDDLLNLEFSRGRPSDIGLEGKDWKEAFTKARNKESAAYNATVDKLNAGGLSEKQRSTLQQKAAGHKLLATSYQASLNTVTSNAHSVQFHDQAGMIGKMINAGAGFSFKKASSIGGPSK